MPWLVQNGRVRASFTACVLLAVLVFAPVGGGAAEVAARVLDAEFTRADLETAGDGAERVARFRDWVWEQVYRRYIVERGLSATPADIAEFSAYQREFERRDRIQRARKLEDLNRRLAGDTLDADERAHLEEFRRVLTRMAERDAEDARNTPDTDDESGIPAAWVEFWKANRSLYEEFGGTVAATRAGPAAYGARVALIADYERRGLAQFLDPRLREQLFELMSRPPAMTVPPERVDFTPFWKLPIPPSYFPE